MLVSALNDYNKERQFRGELYFALPALDFVSCVYIVYILPFYYYYLRCVRIGLQAQLEKEQKINVLRDKKITEISITEVVVGDVCIIKYGNHYLTIRYRH